MTAADGPLTGITGIPASHAAATSACPGSETPGVPASQVSATVSSSESMRETSSGARPSSLCRWQDTMGLRTPSRSVSFMVTRVSSAAIRSHSVSACAARGERSFRLPMGVATTYSFDMRILRELVYK